MSSVFKSKKTKVRQITPREVEPMILDRSELYYELEKKRQKKQGAVSQLISRDNTYGVRGDNSKMTLGG